VERVARDLRYALRALGRTPGFTLVVLVTIAIGTGANATAYGLADALLFREAPGVARPSSLVSVYTGDAKTGAYGSSSYPDFASLKAPATSFGGLAAWQDGALASMSAGDGTEPVRVAAVTSDFFTVLGLQPAVGRLFAAGDADAAAPPVAVISDSLWHRVFNADRQALARSIFINNRSYRVIGVTTPGFAGLDLGRAVDVWIPLVPSAAPGNTTGEANRGLAIVGRLAPRVSLGTAQAELSTLDRAMIVTRHSRLDPNMREQVTRIGWVILGATAFVLLIACANVTSLLLSRASVRAREAAVRLALGASRADLMRQLLTESALLAGGGAACGLLVAHWTVHVLPARFAPEQARLLDAHVDAGDLGVTLLIAVGSAVLVSLAPMRHIQRARAVAALRGDGGHLSDARGGRARSLLVIGQVALACVLLVSTGLLARGLGDALRSDLGVTARNVATVSVDIPPGWLDWDGIRYFNDALAQARALRGVESAAWIGTLPLKDAVRQHLRIEGYTPVLGEDLTLDTNSASADYFAVMRMPLVAGREFDARDSKKAAPVAIVDDLLAAQFAGGAALGRHVTDDDGRASEIVGVVHAGRYRSLQETPRATVYFPLEQNYRWHMTLVARGRADSGALAQALRMMLRTVSAKVNVGRAITLDEHLDQALTTERLTTTLVSVCGVLALGLAMVGVYGVMSYAVWRRTREIGIRLALGARPRHVVALILGMGLRLTLLGLLGGVAGAFVASRLLAGVLHGVNAADPMAFAFAPALLAAMTMVATVVPILRALRVQPMMALREE
jgi:predicted permease